MTRSPVLSFSMLALLTLSAGACGSAARAPAARPSADAVLTEVGDHYAELERIADSVTAEADTDRTASSELAQVAARNLAGRIDRARGGFEAITLAMSTDQLERTRSLWVRLAVTEAALALLYEDATRLAVGSRGDARRALRALYAARRIAGARPGEQPDGGQPGAAGARARHALTAGQPFAPAPRRRSRKSATSRTVTCHCATFSPSGVRSRRRPAWISGQLGSNGPFSRSTRKRRS